MFRTFALLTLALTCFRAWGRCDDTQLARTWSDSNGGFMRFNSANCSFDEVNKDYKGSGTYEVKTALNGTADRQSGMATLIFKNASNSNGPAVGQYPDCTVNTNHTEEMATKSQPCPTTGPDPLNPAKTITIQQTCDIDYKAADVYMFSVNCPSGGWSQVFTNRVPNPAP